MPPEGLTSPLRVAVAQLALGRELDANLETCLGALDEGAATGARLVVLPECALTGYVFDDERAARAAALPLDSDALATLARRCAELGVHCVVGLLERGGDVLFNTVALLAADGSLLATYRKAHLPLLGVDRFVSPGSEPPPVIDTAVGRIGLNVCYDIRFPETARLTALAGADVIAHPANWPLQARLLGESFARVRAAENRVVLAVADRCDSEGGTDFVGLSQIVDPDGEVLVCADRGVEVLHADVDLGAARKKRIVRLPGAYETDLWADRRPDLYGRLVQPVEKVSENEEGSL